MDFQFGIDRLLEDSSLLSNLQGKRVGLMAHPASVNGSLKHSLDLLVENSAVNLTCGFGPQHGIMGDLQDNMMESEDVIHPKYQIPIFSLYGKVRRPTEQMLSHFDVLLIDLQDVGTRIYTYLTTLFYLLEDCAASGKEVWVLDRPNPAGRLTEGSLLQQEFASFVGYAQMPIRHGLTLAEAAKWFVDYKKIDLKLVLVEMNGYRASDQPWPMSQSWVNPSPNIAAFYTARAFPGTVLLEGTTLSEGRGTTIPLEVIGAPDIDFKKIHQWLLKQRPDWLDGSILRHCYFRPTFQKHQGVTCQGLQIHCCDAIEGASRMRSYRLVTGLLKAIRVHYPEYPIWRDFHYEYEKDRLAIDLINGGPLVREFVDDDKISFEQFDQQLQQEESTWDEQRRPFLLYS